MDTQQIKKFTRNWCILVGSVCLIAGIVIGIFIGRAGGFTNSKASPGLSYESGYTLEDTEITSLIYDNYWNYIPTAYMSENSALMRCCTRSATRWRETISMLRSSTRATMDICITAMTI